MHTTARPATSPSDAFVIKVATLARQTAHVLLLLHHPADADDIAQDVTLDCLMALQSGRMDIITTDVAAFVWTMVIRRTLNVARAADRRDTRATACVRDGDEMPIWMSPEAQVECAEIEAFVALTVAALPPMCRRVYQMVREHNASYATIALTLGISRHTVSEHLTTAQRRLRAALVDAEMLAPPLPRTRATRLTAKANEVLAQRLDSAAVSQESAA